MNEAPPRAPKLIPTIYTQPGCRFCNAAKAWLTERDIPFHGAGHHDGPGGPG
jgi:hypothetical protein